MQYQVTHFELVWGTAVKNRLNTPRLVAEPELTLKLCITSLDPSRIQTMKVRGEYKTHVCKKKKNPLPSQTNKTFIASDSAAERHVSRWFLAVFGNASCFTCYRSADGLKYCMMPLCQSVFCFISSGTKQIVLSFLSLKCPKAKHVDPVLIERVEQDLTELLGDSSGILFFFFFDWDKSGNHRSMTLHYGFKLHLC